MSNLLDYLLYKPLLPKIEDFVPDPLYAWRPTLPVFHRPGSIVVAAHLSVVEPALAPLSGAEVIPAPWMAERKQIVFPKSKRKRLRKKFAKNPANFGDVPSTQILVIGRQYFMHPAQIAKMQQILDENRGSQ